MEQTDHPSLNMGSTITCSGLWLRIPDWLLVISLRIPASAS